MTARTRTLLESVAALGVAAVVFVAAFAGTSAAAGAAEPANGSLWDLLEPIYRAFAHGEYVYAGALVLVLTVALAKRYGGDRFPVLHTEHGAASLAFLGAFGASLASRLAGGVELTGAIAWDAAKVGCVAIGGYQGLKTLVVAPLLVPLSKRFPRAAVPLQAVLWVFDSKAKAPAA